MRPDHQPRTRRQTLVQLAVASGASILSMRTKTAVSRGGELFRDGYYEIRAESHPGDENIGGTVPFRPAAGGGQWPKQIKITPTSYWYIDSTNSAVNSDGTGLGADRYGGRQKGGLAPNLWKWSLIGRWFTLQNNEYHGEYFYCGDNPTIVDIPVSVLATLNPTGSGGYLPELHIAYQCNDDANGFFDNSGWIHVAESFIW